MQNVSMEAFQSLIEGGEVLLYSGEKTRIVLRPDNYIVKIFRSKRSARHAKRFIAVAARFYKKGYLAVSPTTPCRCAADNCVYLTYPYIDGPSLRELLEVGETKYLKSAAAFVFGLHERGVYFKDCHPGNLIVHGDDFALLDIHNTRFYLFGLNVRRRAKNLAGFLFRNQTKNLFQPEDVNAFLQQYLSIASYSKKQKKRFWRYFQKNVEERKQKIK